MKPPKPGFTINQKDIPRMTETIAMEITPKEAAMLIRLRKYPFGVIEIHKVNGEPVRMIVKESIALTDEGGIVESTK